PTVLQGSRGSHRQRVDLRLRLGVHAAVRFGPSCVRWPRSLLDARQRRHLASRRSRPLATVRRVPMKVSEIVRLLEQDGWRLKRTTGSHRHSTHPTKPGLVTVAGKPSAALKPKTEASILKTGRSTQGAAVRGYVVVFEGDDASGYSAYSPDLPGVVAA